MPYIKPEYKEALERDLHFLAKRIKIVSREILGEDTEQRLAPYRDVCEKLALSVMPEIDIDYDTLSKTRAVFVDAAEEICRRLNVNPTKIVLNKNNFAFFFERRIKKLAVKVIKIAKSSKKGYHRTYRGILNYCYCVLEQKLGNYPNNKRFASLAAGTLWCLHKRFYDIQMVPYENKQIIKYGDVFPNAADLDCDSGLVRMQCDKKKCDYKLPHYHCKICPTQVNSDDRCKDFYPCCSEKCIKIYYGRTA